MSYVFKGPTLVFVAIVIMAAASACDSDRDHDHDHGAHAGSAPTCNPSGLMTINAQLTTDTQTDAALNVTVVKGSEPVSGAKVTVTPYMEVHGHGNDGSTPAVADGGDGSYAVTGLGLTMAGKWEFTVNVMKDSDMDCTKVSLQVK